MREKKKNKEIWEDFILAFSLCENTVRGRFTRLDSALNEILSRHAYPLEVAKLLAETLVVTALIGESIKLRWKMSIQIRGDGPLKLIATDYFSPSVKNDCGKMRAYANFNEKEMYENGRTGFKNFGRGVFGILIDQGEGTEPYQGITPLAGETVSACAENYFAQSEQLPTTFNLSIIKPNCSSSQSLWRAGGIMLQSMPKSGYKKDEKHSFLNHKTFDSDREKDDWISSKLLLATADGIELASPGITGEQLLHQLFSIQKLELLRRQKISFGCKCSSQKLIHALSIYTQKEIAFMTTDEGLVTADCQFCGQHYEFQPKDLGVKG